MNDSKRTLSQSDRFSDFERNAWLPLWELIIHGNRFLLKKSKATCSHTEVELLAFLSSTLPEGLTISDLALRLGLSSSRTSRIVQSLSDLGLVVTEKPASDARNTIVKVTNLGLRRLQADGPVWINEIRSRFLAGLSSEELEQLGLLLQKMSVNFIGEISLFAKERSVGHIDVSRIIEGH